MGSIAYVEEVGQSLEAIELENVSQSQPQPVLKGVSIGGGMHCRHIPIPAQPEHAEAAERPAAGRAGSLGAWLAHCRLPGSISALCG